MKTVIIIRGLPGSGKSRYAVQLSEKHETSIVCSADHFFETTVTTSGGHPYKEYRFDPTKLPEAHSECFKGFLDALMKGYEYIIVDNTNIHRWEFQNYEIPAIISGYEVKIVEFRAETIEDVKICIRRNTHGVPQNVIANMAVEFEPDTRAGVMPIGN